MPETEPDGVAADDAVLRLVHEFHLVSDGAGGLRLSSQALIFPRVPVDGERDGLSVYLESVIKELGRQPADLIGAKGFDEVWRALANEVADIAPEGLVPDPVEGDFWADPAHALILTPAGMSRNQRKKLARKLVQLFSNAAE